MNPADRVAAWADDGASASSPPREEDRSYGRFDLQAFIIRHGLKVRKTKPRRDGGTLYELEACPFNPEHKKSGISQDAEGKLGFKCFHDSCAEKGWKEVRTLFEPDYQERAANGSGKKASNNGNGAKGTSGNHTVEIPKLLNVSNLLTLEVTPMEMLIESIPPTPGASVLVGSAKAGKTILAVQAAMAVATGTALYKNYRTKPGAAMILEQDDPNGAASIKDIVVRARLRADAPFYVQPRVPFCFGGQFLAWLRSQITEQSLRLAVLDSYTALRGARNAGVDIVKAEREEMAALDALGKETGCAILVLHHSSKGSAALDWSERGGGTYGMNAAVEAHMFITRFPELGDTAPERLFRVRGRHFDGVAMVLRFQKETLDYALVLEGAAAPCYPLLLQIQHAFEEEPFSPQKFYHELGIAKGTAFRYIERLSHAGAIQKTGYGQYVVRVKL